MVGIAFLRGINVGDKGALPMADLRAACEAAGLAHVQTYIQSGNVVFTAPAKLTPRAGTLIEDAVEDRRGFRPPTIVRTLPQLRAIAATKAFPSQHSMDGGQLLVMFLAQTPPPTAAKAVAALSTDAEQLRLIGQEVFMHFHQGVGKAKLSWKKLEQAVGGPGTSRNWNTLSKMLELATALDSAPPQ